MDKLYCCKIDCKELADYEIRIGGDMRGEQDTHACLVHIPDLMTDAIVHEVVRLVAPGDPTPVYR
jgi:hypothetical protein